MTTTFPQLKLKTLVNFPTAAIGRNGITVSTTSGSYYIDLDYSKFTTAPSTPPGSYTLTYNPVTGAYVLAVPTGASPSDAIPLTDGAGGPGVSALYSRADHVHPAATSIFNITSPVNRQFLQYDSGSGKWINATPPDQLAQAVTSGASIAINRSLGEMVTLSLTATVTAFSIANWPAAGILGKITMLISNTGAFNITTWPTGTIWAGGTVPTITSGAGKKDLIVLVSFDGGTTILASIVGQDYR